MKNYFLSVILALSATSSSALELAEFGAHVGSRHDNNCYNDVNPGVYAVSREGWVAGAFENSESRTSVCGALKEVRMRVTVYAGYELRTPELKLGGVGASLFGQAVAGLGYDRCKPLCLGGSVGVRGSYSSWVVRLHYIPKVKNVTSTSVKSLTIGKEF